MVGDKRQMLTTIGRRQVRYARYVMRENGMEKDCLMGMVEGRSKDRQRMKYLGSLRNGTGIESIQGAAGRTKNRIEWRSIIANVNSDTPFGNGNLCEGRCPSQG